MIALFVVILAGIYTFRSHFGSSKFDPVAWRGFSQKQVGVLETSPRATMLKDLLVNHLQVGMPKEKGVALLGPPDLVERNLDSTESHKYYVGRMGCINSKYTYLVVSYDRKSIIKTNLSHYED